MKDQFNPKRACLLGIALIVVAAGCAGSDEGANIKGPAVAPPSGVTTNPMTGSFAGGGSLPPTMRPGSSLPMGTAGAGSVGMNTPGGTMTVTTPATQMPMPCNIQASVKANCQTCHGTTPIGGAPMSLLTYDDFHRDYVVKTSKGLVGQTKKLYELAHTRLNDKSNPMPPSGSLTIEKDRQLLNDWLAGGAVAGTDADRTCTMPGTTDPTMPGDSTHPIGTQEDYDFDPPTPTIPQEQCFELVMHGAQTPGDKSKYTVKTGEYYHQFYFKTPWPSGWVGTKAGGRYDALKVLHHWLLFTTNRAVSADGTHEDVIGTQLGDSAQLIQGWAIGGATSKMPDGVGFELPPANTMLNLQWHYYNSTGSPQQDATAVIMCAVPKEALPNTASMTWLGTENISVPAGQTADAHGTCINDSGAPIHIIQFVPHMHTIGINMKSVVVRTDGKMEEVFNKPFSNTSQLQYDTDVTLAPNDKIISTCTFQNKGVGTVGFGTSTDQEMCYQFAVSYPAHALDNGVISLIGASNTCWQFGE